MIYLDHNATTPIDPRVAEKLAELYGRPWANASSQHRAGMRSRAALDEAGDQVLRLLGGRMRGMESDRLVWTSGGTEANNLALLGLAGQPPGRVILSAIEHPSVLAAAEQLAGRGFTVRSLRCGRDGVVDLGHLDELLGESGPPVRVVSLMLGNNETGALQPVAEVAERGHAAGAWVHTDAVQVVGKAPLDFAALGVDALSLTAHKFHGPRGVGALMLRRRATLTPTLPGGFQQEGLRGGTEPIELALGLAFALDLAIAELPSRSTRMAELRDRLEQRLTAEIPAAEVHARNAPRLPHTTNVAFPPADRQRLLLSLDATGVACSTGSACQSGSSEPSHVLTAMGVSREQLGSSLRLSLGAGTTADEIDAAADAITAAYRRLTP